MLSRRETLRLAATAGAAAALPGGRAPAAAAPFTVPLPIPDVLRPVARTATHDVYRMRMRYADVEIVPGLRTRVQTFNGRFPGPTILARSGRPVVVEQHNELSTQAAVHLHGGHVAHSSDGYPLDMLAPGTSRLYTYPNDQIAAPLWYHDHAHMMEAENVYRGLSGCYLLGDEFEDRLRLPSGRYDIPLMLRDATIAADGTLVYDDSTPFHPLQLVNGRPQPRLEVAARRYRFRFFNAAVARIYSLSLGDGGELVQIGSDGGLLPAPYPTSAVPLWPGERVEAVIDFSRYPVGSSVLLHNTVNLVPGEPADLLRFDVTHRADDDSRVPRRLRPRGDLGAPAAARDFALTYDPAAMQMLINGKSFDPDRVDIRPALGTTELWTVTNPVSQFPIPHTFHVHLAQFQVLRRNGRPPGPAESGVKDTVEVGPGETVSFLIRFTGFTGRYVYHCHMLDHSAMGMMGQMEVGPAGG